MSVVMVLLLLLVVVGAATASDCPTDIIVDNVTTCGIDVYWWSPIGSGLDGANFPLGTTLVHAYTNCTFSIIASSASNISICGDLGYCSTTAPYECVCPPTTTDGFCCSADPVCGNHGDCTTGGICACDDGFGGPWCCPVDNTTGLLCADSGCCMASGGCQCDEGSSGPACETLTLLDIGGDHVTSTSKVVAVVVGSVVAVVGAVVLVGAVGSAAAAGAGAATAATAATATGTTTSSSSGLINGVSQIRNAWPAAAEL